MYTCKHCGTEFNGKFCPECGARNEAVCPNCNAELAENAKFCPECGFALKDAAPAAVKRPSAEGKEGIFKKLYKYSSFVPAALFALFSVLLLAFYAAPLAVAIMGDGFPDESLGNVYSLYCGYLAEAPAVSGTVSALIILFIFGFLCAALAVCAKFLPAFKYKQFKLFGKTVSLNNLLTAVGWFFYLVFFVFGIVIAAMIAAADEGMGIIGAGVCPVLLIVFSLIFALLSAGTFVARMLIAKKLPEFAEEEQGEFQAKRAEYISVCEERAAAKTAEEFTELSEPEEVEKPELYYRAVKFAGFRRAMCVGCIFFSLAFLAMYLFPALLSDKFGSMGVPYLVISLWAVAFIAFFISCLIKPKEIKPKKLAKKGGIVVRLLSCLVGWLGMCVPALFFIEFFNPNSSIYLGEWNVIIWSADMILTAGAYIFYIVLNFVTLSKIKKYRIEVYGTKKVTKTSDPLYSEEQFAEMKEQYSAYLKYLKDKKLYEKGVDYTKYRSVAAYRRSRFAAWLKAHKKLLIILGCVLVLTGIVLAIALPPVFVEPTEPEFPF